jgi:WD40 repeat protein
MLSLSRRRSSADVSYVALAVSPLGTAVAAIDVTGGIADVWDLRTGEPIAALLDGQKAESAALAFSHDGRWLALSAASGVEVYDTATWKRALTVAGPGVEALSFDPTGPQLATATTHGDVSLWTIPSGQRAHHLREVGDKSHHVAFSPDGTFVVASGEDGADRIWNAHTGALQAELKSHHGWALWAEFDSSSRRLVSSGGDGVVVISDVGLRTTVSTLEGSRGPVGVVQFDPSSHSVIGASWNSSARVWDATRSYLRWSTPSVSEDCGRSVRVEPDRRFVAIACANQGTRIWDTADSAGPRLLAELPSPTAVPGDYISPRPAVDALGDRAAIAVDRTVTLHALPGGSVVGAAHHAAAVTTVAFAASGRDLVTGSVDGVVRITRGDGEEFELARLPAAVDTAGFLPDGRVVVADGSKKLGVYDVVRRIRIAQLDLPARVTAFRASANGSRLLTIPTTGGTRSPVLWDLDLLRMVKELDVHQGWVFSARFVAGDREILTAGTDGVARLWDAATGHLRKVYFRSTPYVLDAALDPTGTTVVTAGGDGVLRFWDRSSSRMLWTLRVHDAPVAGVHFEDSDLVTQGFTGEIARWTLPPPPDLATIDGIARCLALRFDEETGGLVEQKQPCDH